MKNNSSIEKSKETIKSIISYLDEKENPQKVTVLIEINYETKTFDVKNNNNTKNFEFTVNSHKSNMWLATCEAIINGINEAKKVISEYNKSLIDHES